MTENKILYTGDWLSFNKRGTFEFVTRNSDVQSAIIIAVNAQKKLVLVEQYRASLDAYTLELPAGLIGDEADFVGEVAHDAAMRELLEETGYQAQHMEKITHGPISSGMSNEIMHFFVAHNIEKVGPGGGDASENITVHEVPLDDVPSTLHAMQKEGMHIDPKIFIGLYAAHYVL